MRTDREKRFVLACFAQTDGGSFNWRTAGEAAGFSQHEADDLAQILYEKGIFHQLGLGNKADFTARGRELTRELQEAARIEREAEQHDLYERILIACYDASLAQNNNQEFDLDDAAKHAGLPDRSAAAHLFVRIRQNGLIELVTRGWGRVTREGIEEVQRIRAKRTGTHIGETGAPEQKSDPESEQLRPSVAEMTSKKHAPARTAMYALCIVLIVALILAPSLLSKQGIWEFWNQSLPATVIGSLLVAAILFLVERWWGIRQ